jgi:hypothetical protein
MLKFKFCSTILIFRLCGRKINKKINWTESNIS